MTFSRLYSAITRGKWFVDFREVESHQLLIDKLLEHGVDTEDRSPLSERKPLMAYVGDETSMAYTNNFSDAPQGSIAVVSLHGPMLKYGTWCSYGTTEVAEMIDEAVESPRIAGIVLDVDSGGGSVDAIAPLIQSIQKAQQKGKAVVACCDLCASAAYYVVCHCDEIMASNSISAEFGSIGVMMSFKDYAKHYEKEGIVQHTIYSNLSTHKNGPFEAALKGEYDQIKAEELDPLAKQFQEAVKHQRGSRLDANIEGLIAGRMFFADNAQKNGLIDSVGTLEIAVKRAKEIRRDAVVDEYIKLKS